jgi:hypothetical protein
MKISFDFDSTLSRRSVQKIVRELIKRGDEIHIVTSRYADTTLYADYRLKTNQNRDLFRVSDHLGIKRENIHFTDMRDKSEYFLKNSDFVVHLDDDIHEFNTINYETAVGCILCDKHQEWQLPFKAITNLENNENN